MMNEILKSISFEGEQWKQTLRRSKVIPGYLISNFGRVFSLKTNKLLKIQNNVHKERGNASTVTLSIPFDWSEDYQYANNSIMCQVHQLVADAFIPIDENPPDKLSDSWDQIITEDMIGQKRIPESWKQWVKETVIIDHVNNNPFDNRYENLNYTTCRGNNTHYKKKQNEKNYT
jgi:hypothetical protein